MKRVWDAILVLIITLFVVNALLAMVQPYALHIIITVLVFLLGSRVYNRYRHW